MSLNATNDNVVTPDRRRSDRRRVLLAGKIAYTHNGFSSDCRVHDLSSGGARIIVGSHDSVDQDACLIVVRDGKAHQTRTIWTEGVTQGVAFTDTVSLTDAVPTHLMAMRRLWVENLPR